VLGCAVKVRVFASRIRRVFVRPDVYSAMSNH
jgi:hypothetical protein